ncbi:MAG: AI-2E family transporter, partial [Candidatus Tectimicrobiota bacterium]
MIHAMDHERRIQTVCLLALTTFAVGAALYFLRPVLIPFVLAIFFTYCLAPVIELQKRYLRMPRWLAILSTLLFGVMLLGFVGLVVSASVGQMSDNAHVYQDQINQLLDKATAALPLERFGVNPEGVATSLSQIPRETIRSLVSSTIGAIVNVLSNGLLVVIFMIFMLVGSRATEASTAGIRGEVQFRIERFILTKVLVSAATGVVVGTVLALLGVQFAMAFGLFAFMLNFTP